MARNRSPKKRAKALKRRAPAKRPASPAALDAKTGRLKFDDWDTPLGPTLTRKAFLASPLGRAMHDLVVNEPWHSWQLSECKIGGETFLVGVFYEGEALNMVQLFLQDPHYGTSWDDFSPEKEKARRTAHGHWLGRQLNRAGARTAARDEHAFPWGEAGVYYDHHNDQSPIIISYRHK